jgi:hypothetical protein
LKTAKIAEAITAIERACPHAKITRFQKVFHIKVTHNPLLETAPATLREILAPSTLFQNALKEYGQKYQVMGANYNEETNEAAEIVVLL